MKIFGFSPNGTAFQLPSRPGGLVVGRWEAGLDFFCPLDVHLSRRHARIVQLDGRLFVEDLGSSSGTFVDGAAVSGRTRVGNSAVIVMGMTAFLAFDEDHLAQRRGQGVQLSIPRKDGVAQLVRAALPVVVRHIPAAVQNAYQPVDELLERVGLHAAPVKSPPAWVTERINDLFTSGGWPQVLIDVVDDGLVARQIAGARVKATIDGSLLFRQRPIAAGEALSLADDGGVEAIRAAPWTVGDDGDRGIVHVPVHDGTVLVCPIGSIDPAVVDVAVRFRKEGDNPFGGW